MHVRRLATHVEILTPAKINLFLEVLGQATRRLSRDRDAALGRRTVYDSLTFTPRAAGRNHAADCAGRWAIRRKRVTSARHRLRRMNCSVATCPPAAKTSPGGRPIWCGSGREFARRDNAPGKANSGCGRPGWRVERRRRRPGRGQCGLELELAARAIARVGRELGSDVPFFLTRGAAVCRGRGEQIEPCRATRLHCRDCSAAGWLEHAARLSACRPAEQPIGVESIDRIVGTWERRGRGPTPGQRPAAGRGELDTLDCQIASRSLQRQDVLGHQMSGSGSSYFGLCRSARHARRVASRLAGPQRIGSVFQAQTAVAS